MWTRTSTYVDEGNIYPTHNELWYEPGTTRDEYANDGVTTYHAQAMWLWPTGVI